MDGIVVSWDGHDINDGLLLSAVLPKGLKDQPDSEPVFVSMGGRHPVYGGKELNSVTLALAIEMMDDPERQIDQLKRMFPTHDLKLRKLVVRERGSGKLFFVYGTASSFRTKLDIVTIILALASPVWQCEAETVDDWYMTAGSATREITLNGSVKVAPSFELSSEQAKTGGFGFGRWIAIYNTSERAMTNVGIDVVKASLDTLSLYNAGKMLENGEDLRLFVDGGEAYRWPARMRQATTGLFARMSFQPGISVTIKTAFTAATTITEIEVQNTAANRAALKALMKKNMPVTLFANGEAFTCTDIHLGQRKLLGVTAGAKHTVRGDHAAAERWWWVEHDVVLAYDNPALAAPETDDSQKPMFDVDTSSNSSHVYLDFWDEAGQRTGRWNGSVVKSNGQPTAAVHIDQVTQIYSATHGSDADPASVMGMAIKSYPRSGRWQPENGSLECAIEEPFGVTAVSTVLEKRRTSSSWPATAGLQKSVKGVSFVSVWNEGSPSNTAWAEVTRNNVSLGGTFYHVKYMLAGTVAAGANYEADLEIKSTTLALDATNVPTIFIGPEWSFYDLDLTITNLATSESLQIAWTLAQGQKMVVNCGARTVTVEDNTNAIAARSLSTDRLDWLDVEPGLVRLQFDDAGTTRLHVVTRLREARL